MKHLAVLTCLSLFLTGRLSKAENIAAVEGTTTPPSVSITSSPIVTAILAIPGVINGIGSINYSFLAQDSSGSINLVGSLSGTGYTPTVGDAINLSGIYSAGSYPASLSHFPVVTNLNSITLVSSGNTLPTPATYTIPQLNVSSIPQSIEGYLVQMDDVTISGGSGTFASVNTTYTVTDAASHSMTLKDWASNLTVDAALAGMTIPTGAVNILGVDSNSGGVAQFIPYQITAVPEPSTFSLVALSVGLGMWRLRRRK